MTHIKRIDEFVSKDLINKNLYRTLNDAKNAIERIIYERCSYDRADCGVPINPGKILDYYGSKCKWAIRSKEWGVHVVNHPIPHIELEWITQEDINNATSINCLKGMLKMIITNSLGNFGEMPKLDYEIYFICGYRGSSMQYRWKLVINDDGTSEIMDDNE